MGKIIMFFSGFGVFAVIGLFVLNLILGGLLAMTYSSLTKEDPIAIVTFEKVSPDKPNEYVAHLYDANASSIGDYRLCGNQWRIDAKFIKMKYLANILGIDSKYALNRIEGRYKSIEDENTLLHKSYEIEDTDLVDFGGFFFDTMYGSSVYKDIELHTKYRVLKTPTGLMVREEPFVVKPENGWWENMKKTIGF